MCVFFSCIVTKDGTVLFDPMSDSHEDIIDQNKEKFDLRDDTVDPDKLRFARVEITPPDGDVFRPVKDWNFNIDQRIKPTWWCDEYKKQTLKTLKRFLKGALLLGKELEELSGDGRYWVRDCKLLTVKGDVLIVRCENSQVGTLCENSQVGELWGNSQVGELRGNSQVGTLWGNSQVGTLRENSQVGTLRGNSRIEVFSDDAKFNVKENAIAIIRTGNNPRVIVANDKIEISVQ